MLSDGRENLEETLIRNSRFTSLYLLLHRKKNVNLLLKLFIIIIMYILQKCTLYSYNHTPHIIIKIIRLVKNNINYFSLFTRFRLFKRYNQTYLT